MNTQTYLELLFSTEAKRVVTDLRTLSTWQDVTSYLKTQGYSPPSYLGSTNSSAKIVKGEKYNVDTFVMYLSPAKFAGYGNVCPQATKGCEASCLNMSGRANFDKSIVQARVIRTWLWYGCRDLFNERLFKEITSAKKRALSKGHEFAVRLNGTSDISPLMFKHNDQDVLTAFPDTSFYDYTKVAKRIELLKQYDNYHLTYSWHDGATWSDIKTLGQDVAIAVPFYDLMPSGRIKIPKSVTLPTTYQDLPVFDGDASDLRHLDRQLGAPKRGSYIVGLRAKRTNPQDEQVAIDTGFFQPIV